MDKACPDEAAFFFAEKPVLPFSVCLKRLPVSETFLKHLSDMLE